MLFQKYLYNPAVLEQSLFGLFSGSQFHEAWKLGSRNIQRCTLVLLFKILREVWDALPQNDAVKFSLERGSLLECVRHGLFSHGNLEVSQLAALLSIFRKFKASLVKQIPIRSNVSITSLSSISDSVHDLQIAFCFQIAIEFDCATRLCLIVQGNHLLCYRILRMTNFQLFKNWNFWHKENTKCREKERSNKVL